MSILFHDEGHTYKNINPEEQIRWTSVSTLCHYFVEAFDQEKKAASASVKKEGKWFGIPPAEIVQIWQNEALRSTTLGTWYHKKEEDKLRGLQTIQRYGKELPIIMPVVNEAGWKVAQDQRLIDAVYPELLVYLRSVGVCGQSDDVTVANNLVYVDDHKSNKDIKKPTFVNWEGKTKRLLAPLLHLEDNQLVKYGLQLNVYLYIILRNNPQLGVGGLALNNVTFELAGEDRFGYPVLRLENGEPIVKDVERIPLPYMKREVEIMFDWLKNKNAVR
jgi:hypothetical protein